MEHLNSLLATATPVLHTEEWIRLQHIASALVPPNNHVMPVTNALSAGCGLFWAASYILLTKKAFSDRSYGMPIYALCLNITWELIYALIYPPDAFNATFFLLEAVVDVFLFAATIRFGQEEWKHSPLVARNLSWVILVMTGLGFWLQLALASELIPAVGRQVVFYSSWPLQIVIGVGSIEQIVSRGSTRGHSWSIWATRALGTLCAAICFQYRVIYWPERFGYAAQPIAVFLVIMSAFFDAVYPFAYMAVQRQEKAAGSAAVHGSRSLEARGANAKVK